jgi:elongation factor P
MAALIEAINVKRKSLFEFENAPFVCLDSDISTPTARGGQTLVRLKMRNLLNQAVFDKTFETYTLTDEMVGDASDFLIDGLLLQMHKYNGNPIGLQLPIFVELDITYTEPAVRGDTSSGATKTARLETGLEIKVPLFIKEGEKIKVSTETRSFSSRA